MTTLRLLARSAAVLAVLFIAGCGGSGSGSASTAAGTPPPGGVLFQQVNTAVGKATSVHVLVTAAGSGQALLSMTMARSGDLSGQMDLQIPPDYPPVTLLVTQGQSYIKVTASGVKTVASALKVKGPAPAVCKLICGKYLKLTAAQFKSLAGGGLTWSDDVSPASEMRGWRYVRTVALNGQSVWQMRLPVIGDPVYVAARAPHYTVRTVIGPDRFDYTEWNTAPIPPSPPASEVVDFSELTHV